MSGESGFVDLRLNQQEGQVNESFWPSFTDIMTVIVMIFLIAMVVLLMRNIELVNELRSTMEAERVAWELARTTGEEKATLSSQLHAAQDQVSALRMQMMRLQERNLAQETTIVNQGMQITELTAGREALKQRNAQLSLVRDSLEVDLESAQIKLLGAEQHLANLEANIARLEQNLEAVQARFAGAQNKVSELQQDVVHQQRQLEASRGARQEAERKYQALAGDFDELQVAYNRLIRPARSPEGRRLVEVRYWKREGAYRIAYREGGIGAFQEITREQLDQRLTRLRESTADGLYVKVIFPENSGLSYNEAFSFTTHVHRNYDYYFQTREQERAAPHKASQ
jgi:hypothetical protein